MPCTDPRDAWYAEVSRLELRLIRQLLCKITQTVPSHLLPEEAVKWGVWHKERDNSLKPWRELGPELTFEDLEADLKEYKRRAGEEW